MSNKQETLKETMESLLIVVVSANRGHLHLSTIDSS